MSADIPKKPPRDLTLGIIHGIANVMAAQLAPGQAGAYCSFCHKPKASAAEVVGVENGVAICRVCFELAAKIFAERDAEPKVQL